MDEADIAQAQMEEEERLAALERARRAQLIPIVYLRCQECDEELPQARKDHGFRLCVDCATTAELQQRVRLTPRRGFS